jgi:prolyl 4-hydroxylase
VFHGRGTSICVMEHVPQTRSEADVAHDMALRAAEGIGVSQNWAAALDHLLRSAQLGSRLAQAELAGLSGEWALALDILAGKAMPDSPWLQFRSFIDLTKWMLPPQLKIVSERPRITATNDFVEPEICDWLIARACPILTPADVFDREKRESYFSDIRTNSSCELRGEDSDFILALLRARIADVTEMQVCTMEPPQILHYAVGQEFRPHFDIIIDPGSPDYAKKLAEGRQRVLTFLLSLNDDYEGGETAFPAIRMRWKGRRGRALFFWNVEPDGTLDRRTLHGGRPVTRGEKWMLSQWVDGLRPRELGRDANENRGTKDDMARPRNESHRG